MEYRITTDNILIGDESDCYIAPDDPFHQLKIAHQMGGLGSEQRLAEYRAAQLPQFQSKSTEQIEFERTLKPGTDEWFKHHFAKRNNNAI